jgi:hypothetical protein
MTTNVDRPPEAWHNQGARIPVRACRLQIGDLKRLYRILNKKVFEYRDVIMLQLARGGDETEETFGQRKARVYNSFVTSVTIQTAQGNMFTGNNEDILDEHNLPEQIVNIFLSTRSVPATVLPIVMRFVNVNLDFTQPPVLDFSRFPTLPTENATRFEIQSDNELWFLGAKTELSDYFVSRKTGVDWLHRGGSYDALLFLAGIPLGIWVLTYLVQIVEAHKFPTFISYSIYVYGFFFTLNLFRIFFSYSRWVFPKIELETHRSAALRQRIVWGAIIVAVLGAAIWDAFKTVFF